MFFFAAFSFEMKEILPELNTDVLDGVVACVVVVVVVCLSFFFFFFFFFCTFDLLVANDPRVEVLKVLVVVAVAGKLAFLYFTMTALERF